MSRCMFSSVSVTLVIFRIVYCLFSPAGAMFSEAESLHPLVFII